MKIVIILPTYNERVNIQKMIPLLEEEVIPSVKQHELSILVVDDNSPDGTAEEVKHFMHKWHNIKLLQGSKEGLGAAYVRGMKYAMDEMHADAVVEFDSDFQHDPYDIPRLIKAMDDGADYVIGSRYIPGGSVPKEWGWHRKFISYYGGSIFGRLGLWHWGIHDITSGFKLTKTKFLKKVDLDHIYSKYYAYKLHILHDVVTQGAKVVEVPIVFYERQEGSSKLTSKDMTDSFVVVMKLRLRDSKRFLQFLIVGGTGFFLQMVVTAFAIQWGSPQFIAAMIGGEAAILSNFFINNTWTFGDTKHVKEQGHFFRRLVKFNVASLGSIGTQGFVVYVAVLVLGSHFYIWGRDIPTSLVILVPTIILIVIPMNYFIYNKLIWKTQYLKKSEQS